MRTRRNAYGPSPPGQLGVFSPQDLETPALEAAVDTVEDTGAMACPYTSAKVGRQLARSSPDARAQHLRQGGTCASRDTPLPYASSGRRPACG
ncbi:hypothetical protein [Streptomyces chartreusis]